MGYYSVCCLMFQSLEIIISEIFLAGLLARIVLVQRAIFFDGSVVGFYVKF